MIFNITNIKTVKSYQRGNLYAFLSFWRRYWFYSVYRWHIATADLSHKMTHPCYDTLMITNTPIITDLLSLGIHPN